MLKNESFKANSNSMEGSVLNALYGGAFVCFSKFITFEFIKKKSLHTFSSSKREFSPVAFDSCFCFHFIFPSPQPK